MSAEGTEREGRFRLKDERVGLRGQDGGTPAGGCLEVALLTRQPRPGPPEPRVHLGPTVPARPSPTVPERRRQRPEFCGRGARGPGVHVELGLTRGGAGGGGGGGGGGRGPGGLRKRSVGAAPARGVGAPTARGRGLRP